MSKLDKHIVIVTSEFPPQPGGIGNHAYNLALHLTKENYIIQVIADQRSKTGDEEAVFDKKSPFTAIRIQRYKWRFIMYLKRIITTYSSMKNASHVIATGKFSLWNVAFLSLFFKCQTIAVVHGSEVNFKSFVLKKSIDGALKRMHNIIAVSNYTKNLISHINKEVEVIPNGIDLDNWSMNNVVNRHLRGNPSLTTVGRVSTRKGQLNVIKQLPELIKHFPELHYHCIGIPTEANDFMKVANELHVDPYITFHGSLDDQSLKQVLSKTDIFIMLSSESKTGDVEGFGIAILEANAAGIPAIGSKGCGIEDAIKQNTSGVLIELDNTMEFRSAIMNILQSKKSYQLGAEGWAKKHDWSRIIKRYIALFE